MAKCFHCHRTAVPGYSLCQAHLKSSQNGTWCGINGVYKPVRECKLNHAICECGKAIGSAPQQAEQGSSNV